jgi:PAS domain S-box-containing protein
MCSKKQTKTCIKRNEADIPPKKINSRETSDAAGPLIRRCQAKAKLSELRKKTGPLPAAEVDLRRLVHELEVHQIELEMQNEELVRARAEAETAQRQFEDLYDFAPVGYFTLARDGAIVQVNLTGANLLGVERAKLLKQRFGLFVVEEFRPAFINFLEQIFERREKETLEVTLRRNGQESYWSHIEASYTEGDEACRVVVVDITRRKQAEQLRHFLDRHGYRVMLAQNDRQAMALLKGRKPALVISDINMPEMNGSLGA